MRSPALNPAAIHFSFWPPDFLPITAAWATVQPYIDPTYPERDMSPAADLQSINRFLSLLLLGYPSGLHFFFDNDFDHPKGPETHG